MWFDPRVKKNPWNRKEQPTPVFLPGKFHGQRSLLGYSPGGCHVRHDRAHTYIFLILFEHRLLPDVEYSSLWSAVNPRRLSVLYVVVHIC